MGTGRLYDANYDTELIAERQVCKELCYELKDYTAFAGKVPLPPRYAFGYWWSRYWSYSDWSSAMAVLYSDSV